MSLQTERDERLEAWSSAKLAVRSYARDPSDSNARNVSRAWRKVRDLVGGAVERRIALELDAMGRRYRP